MIISEKGHRVFEFILFVLLKYCRVFIAYNNTSVQRRLFLQLSCFFQDFSIESDDYFLFGLFIYRGLNPVLKLPVKVKKTRQNNN